MNQLINSWFHGTVSALAYSSAQTRANTSTPGLETPYNDLTNFILEQHARMAGYLRGPLMAATLGFDLLGFFHGGKRFQKLPPALRACQMDAWRNSRIGFKRDLVRYFDSLAMLELHSRSAMATCAPVSPVPIPPGQIISNPANESRHEIVVIGSGPGGAITACLLAEAGRKVLLMEEGEYFSLESCVPFSKQEMVQKYRNGGQTVAMGANKVAYVEGRCVGGGSEINSGLYHRTPPEILETWRKEFRVEGLAQEELRPH
ncbi:MAG TPA: GMC family oxidoreductase N-terminal domain-containing protein, partial [Verrucomicrobiae bacterium]|nr:GMC family oxidoreductase N-terminal domain-containing protein [Verrucomicrobiae bacterium]